MRCGHNARTANFSRRREPINQVWLQFCDQVIIPSASPPRWTPVCFLIWRQTEDIRKKNAKMYLRSGPKVDLNEHPLNLIAGLWLLSLPPVYLSCEQKGHWCSKTMLLAISIPNTGVKEDWYAMEKAITIPLYLKPEATNEGRAEVHNNCKAHRAFI